MSNFNIIPLDIPGLLLIEPAVYRDARGYFMETWNERELAAAGLSARFVQDNESYSVRGVLRGLHFQKSNPQGKLVRVLSGEVYDVAVDLRRTVGGQENPFYARWHGEVLSAENKRQFYIPEGFAHGFCVLSETAQFAYKCTRFYDPADEGGILYCDPDIGVKWPKLPEVILSDKDKRNPRLADARFEYRL